MGQLLTVTDVSTACVVVIFDCEDNYLTGCRTLVAVNNCLIQDFAHRDDHAQPTINIGWPILLTPPLPPTHPILHSCLLS